MENATSHNKELFIARISIEALSPISSASGDGLGIFDMTLARDANGLPIIHGSSIQGLMRELFGRINPVEKVKKYFGCGVKNNEIAGRVQFSPAQVHNCDNQAISGLVFGEVSDNILTSLRDQNPLLRDHVKINEFGAAVKNAKFERVAAPKGTRFSFELTMIGENNEDFEVFESIVSLVRHPLFLIGGATRRGYGKVKCNALKIYRFSDPLNQTKEISNLRRKALSDYGDVLGNSFNALEEKSPEFTDVTRIEIALTPRQFWRMGSDGVRIFKPEFDNREGADNHGQKVADAAFNREPFIDWQGSKSDLKTPEGEFAEDFVIAGAAVKGAIIHRMRFHYNRLNNRFIKLDNGKFKMPDSLDDKAKRPFYEFIGFAKENEKQGGRAAFHFEDIVFKPKGMRVADNVKLDAFSNAPINGALFSEERVDHGEIKLVAIIDDYPKADNSYVYQAFKMAINDLTQSRLSLGAKSSGRFDGKTPQEWSEKGGGNE